MTVLARPSHSFALRFLSASLPLIRSLYVSDFIHLFPYFPFVYEIRIKPEGEGLYFFRAKCQTTMTTTTTIEKLDGMNRAKKSKKKRTQWAILPKKTRHSTFTAASFLACWNFCDFCQMCVWMWLCMRFFLLLLFRCVWIIMARVTTQYIVRLLARLFCIVFFFPLCSVHFSLFYHLHTLCTLADRARQNVSVRSVHIFWLFGFTSFG